MQRQSKADLHVHSKYSDRPAEWFLRRVGAPECFVEPIEVYRRAQRRGMDFVTIADHNSIRGALEIADLPGAFLSNEVTTYFPEDGCKIHILVCGIDEAQFQAIQRARACIYDLHRCLTEENIFCAVNHPLFRVNNRLTIEHVEKLLLMFKRFESINGSRGPRGALLLKAVLDNLTPALIAEMAERHGIEPTGPEPWRKWTTGGSDDHSGVHAGAAYTATPPAADVGEFLDHLRGGRHRAAGAPGGSLLLAHSLYTIAYSYYKNRFLGDGKTSVVGQMLDQLLTRSGARSGKLSQLAPGFVKRLIWARRMRGLGEVERLIVAEASGLLASEPWSVSFQAPADNRQIFAKTCRLAHLLGYGLAEKFGAQIRQGRVVDALQSAASLGAVALGVAPYLAAFSTQHKDEPFLRAVAGHFPATRRLACLGGGKALVTDAFADVNRIRRAARALNPPPGGGNRVAALTCLESLPPASIEVKNFAPVGAFDLLGGASIGFPPFLEVFDYVETRGFDELIISTPGPLGLTGLAAAKLLGLRTTGIYRENLPLLIRRITRDHGMEQLMRRYMQWFYAQMDRVLAPHEPHRQRLVEAGFDASRLAVGTWADALELTGGRSPAESRREPAVDFRRVVPGSTSGLIVMDVA